MNKNFKRRKIEKRKGRFNISIIILVCLISIVFFNQNCLAKKQLAMKQVCVNNNDTLWSIAGNICDKNESLNIQNVIIDIKKINNLDNSNIYVGQTLFIPSY